MQASLENIDLKGYHIIIYDNRYRDDAIFCVLASKDSLGRRPGLNEDLLDIQKNYFNNNDKFWLAIDNNDRVIATLGTKIVSRKDMWLKRLFVKPCAKGKGVGSELLSYAIQEAKSRGMKLIHTRFPDEYLEAEKFYSAKGFVEDSPSCGMRHFIYKIV